MTNITKDETITTVLRTGRQFRDMKVMGVQMFSSALHLRDLPTS